MTLAPYAGLSLLADFQPDLIKLDMGLVRNIDRDRAQCTILRSMVQMCEKMKIQVIADGVETAASRNALRDAGIHLMQGYFFARPAFQAMATLSFDKL